MGESPELQVSEELLEQISNLPLTDGLQDLQVNAAIMKRIAKNSDCMRCCMKRWRLMLVAGWNLYWPLIRDPQKAMNILIYPRSMSCYQCIGLKRLLFYLSCHSSEQCMTFHFSRMVYPFWSCFVPNRYSDVKFFCASCATGQSWCPRCLEEGFAERVRRDS